MYKNVNKETSGHGVAVNTWIIIFLIVIAAHLIVILSVVGFKMLKGDKGILKTNEEQPSREIKPPEEDYKLNLPPEENNSLEQVINSLVNPQPSSGSEDKDDETVMPPISDKGLLSPQDPPSESAEVPKPVSAAQTHAEATHPKQVKPGDSPENTGNYYIVVEGDTLRKIASKTGVSIDEIRKINRLDKDVVKLGQKLIIPGKTAGRTPVSAANAKKPVNVAVDPKKSSTAPAGNYKTYRVGKGDTLNKIAALFHTTPENLAKINDIGDPRKLKAGMEIKVPKE
ncbi:MAG: LysM peptidoglycan-binding domain-containing protein [Victivallales bacterium]|jgi:LysM repeat protein